MTKDKFRDLCREVLVPQIGDLLHAQLAEMQQTLDAFAQELIRSGARLDYIALQLSKMNKHGDQ